MCSTHTYTLTHTRTHTLCAVCRWPSFNALEKWFDCASSVAQFAVEFLYKLGLPLMASARYWTLHPLQSDPGIVVAVRVLCVCFKFMIWNATLKSESGEISFAFANVFWFHLCACLRFAWHFTFAALTIYFFFFSLCAAFRLPFCWQTYSCSFIFFFLLFTYFIFICSLSWFACDSGSKQWNMLMMPCCLSSMRKDARIVALTHSPGRTGPRAVLA